MTLQAFALLCALATLSCVGSAVRATQLAFVVGGMLASIVLMLPATLALPWAPLLVVEPTQISLLLALFALARLRGSVRKGVALFVGGALAIVWLQALRGVGWPFAVALPFVLCVVAIAGFAGLKREFFPAALQDEVVLLTLVAGLLVALIPGVLAGWNSAEALQGSSAAAAASGKNVVWVAAAFVVLGAAFTWMKSAWWKMNRRWIK